MLMPLIPDPLQWRTSVTTYAEALRLWVLWDRCGEVEKIWQRFEEEAGMAGTWMSEVEGAGDMEGDPIDLVQPLSTCLSRISIGLLYRE